MKALLILTGLGLVLASATMVQFPQPSQVVVICAFASLWGVISILIGVARD